MKRTSKKGKRWELKLFRDPQKVKRVGLGEKWKHKQSKVKEKPKKEKREDRRVD